MSHSPLRALTILVMGAALSGSLIGFAAAGAGGGSRGLRAAKVAAARSAPRAGAASPPRQAAPAPPRAPIEGFDPLAQRVVGERVVSDLPGGRRAELTLDAGLQEHLRALLKTNAVPSAAVVALDPSSGRVLAYVSHSSRGHKGDLARDATPPSASVFKLITAAALLDHGVEPQTRVCYGGGLSRLLPVDLVDNRRRDRSCATLADAVARSINAVIAKLADRNLSQEDLDRYARAFGYGRPIPFDAAAPRSECDIPDERLERARAAAGFWHTHLSPLHGALIAAAIANDGMMPRPFMVERVLDAKGRVIADFEPGTVRNVISRQTARTLGRMMTGTVSHGTSRSAFYDRRGRPWLPGIEVAGKTGSLHADRPFRAYSWWVGYAPQQAPKLAVAALVVNDAHWRIKASYVGREALRYVLQPDGKPGATSRAPAGPSPR